MTLHLDIAGIHFEAIPPPGRRLVVEDPRYAAFLSDTRPGGPRVDVPVRVTFDEPPDVRDLDVVFDSGSAWKGYRDGDDLVFELRMPEPPRERHWTARLPASKGPVTIHCGAPLRDARAAPGELISPLCYPLDQILLMCLLPQHHGVLVHSAGLRRGERAVVFPGRSGAGKSTLSRLLHGAAGLGRMSDDRMVLRRDAGGLRAWGTPWAGTEQVAENESAPLGAIAFLHQSPRSELRRIGPAEGLGQILPVASVPWFDEDLTARCLAFCDELLRGVPLYELHFRRHEEVREVVGELFSSD